MKRAIYLILNLVLLFLLQFSSILSAPYQKELCEFRTPNYSIAWAYEPKTHNVVFMLKAAHNLNESEDDGFWTGVGFEDEKLEVNIKNVHYFQFIRN